MSDNPPIEPIETRPVCYDVDWHPDGFKQAWYCPAPNIGVPFRVTEQRWNEDHTERTILAIEIDPDWLEAERQREQAQAKAVADSIDKYGTPWTHGVFVPEEPAKLRWWQGWFR